MADGMDLEDILNSFEDSSTGYQHLTNDQLYNLSSRQQFDELHQQLPSTYGEPLTTGFTDYPLEQDKSDIGRPIKDGGSSLHESVQGGSTNSLGTMFLSSVENMLTSSQNPPNFGYQLVKQQSKPKQNIGKESKKNNMPKMSPHGSYGHHQQGAVEHQQPVYFNRNISNNMNMPLPAHQIDLGGPSQPFVTPLETQDDKANSFVRPPVQHKPPTPGQPTMPLSSSYMSAAQPSPANSNYSGDPPTPLSHHPTTPQSNRSITPHSNQPMQQSSTMQDIAMTQQVIFPSELSNHSFHDQNMELSNSSPMPVNNGRWNTGGLSASHSNYEGRNLSNHSTSGYSSAYQSDSSVPSNGSNINSNLESQNKISMDNNLYNPLNAALSHDVNLSSSQLQKLSNVMSPPIISTQQFLPKDNVQDMQMGIKGLNTMNMINRASNVAKNAFSNPYEAISPDNNYVPSPSSRTTDGQMDLDLQAPKQKQNMNDPVLVYVKDSSNGATSRNNLLNFSQNSQIFPSTSAGNTRVNNYGTQQPDKTWNISTGRKLSSDNALLYNENDLQTKTDGYNSIENLSSNSGSKSNKQARNPSKNKSKKKDTFEEDFGFGSSEPTIKLGGSKQPLLQSVPEQEVIAQSVPSTQTYSPAFLNSSMDSEMQNSMNEIARLQQQQKEMMERLRKMQNLNKEKTEAPPPRSTQKKQNQVSNNKVFPTEPKQTQGKSQTKPEHSVNRSRQNTKTQDNNPRNQKEATIKYGAPPSQNVPRSVSSSHAAHQQYSALMAQINPNQLQKLPVATLPTTSLNNRNANTMTRTSASTMAGNNPGLLPSVQTANSTISTNVSPFSQYEKHFVPPTMSMAESLAPNTMVDTKPTFSLAPMQTVKSTDYEIPASNSNQLTNIFSSTAAISQPNRHTEKEVSNSMQRNKQPEISASTVINNATMPSHLWNPMAVLDNHPISNNHPIYLPNYGQVPGMPSYAIEMQRAAACGYPSLFPTISGIPPSMPLPSTSMPLVSSAISHRQDQLKDHTLLYNKPVKPISPDLSQITHPTSQSVNKVEINKKIEKDLRKLPAYESREVFPPVCTPLQFMPPVMPSSLPPPSIVSKMSPNPLISKALNLHNGPKSSSKPSKEKISAPTFKGSIASQVNKQPVTIALTSTVSSSTVPSTPVTSSVSVPLTSLQKIINKSVVPSAAPVINASTSHPYSSSETYYGPKKQKLREASYYKTYSKPTVSTAVVQTVKNTEKANAGHMQNKQDETITDKAKNLNINSHNNNVLQLEMVSKATVKEEVRSAIDEEKSSGKSKSSEPRRPKVQSTHMFSLFDSLLQEASKTASKALKTKEPSKNGQGAEVESLPGEENVVVHTGIDLSVISTPLPNQPTSTVSVPSSAILTTSNKKVNVPTAAAPKPIENPKLKVDSIALNLKNKMKPTRPPATFPFKRRPFPDPETFHASVVNSVIATTTSTPLPNNVSIAKPLVKATTVKPISPKVVPVSTAIVSKHTETVVKKPTVMSSVVTTTSTSLIASTSKLESVDKTKLTEKPADGLPPSGIKLKITAFRSVGGKIIHQSAVLNKAGVTGAVVEDSEGTGSDRSYKKKSKKRKKKKQRKRTSSSECDSVASGSSYEPLSKNKKTEKVNLSTIAVLKNLNKTLEKNIAAVPLPPIPKKLNNKSKREHTGSDKEEDKSIKKMKKDPTPVKVSSESDKKSATLRYKPKFAQNTTADSTTKSNMVQIHRPVGKVPSYLATSKSTILNSVPTIQLVARNTSTLHNALQDNTKYSTSTNVSKSVSGKQPIYVKPGVQYILNTSRNANQILTAVSTNNNSKAPAIITDVKQPIATVVTPKIKVLLSNSVTLPKSITVVSPKPKTVLKTRPTPVESSKASPSLRSMTTVELNTNEPSANFKFADSFQISFLKLVNTQNTTTYIPPKPPAHLQVKNYNRKHHKCLECKDEFMFKSSLDHHFDRRSLIIRVFCAQCKQVLIFLNKCKFMRHAREHASDSTCMQFSNPQLKPIPLAMCKALSKEEYFSIEPPEPNKYVLVPVAEDAKKSRSACMLACTECSYFADTHEDLENHFQDSKPSSSPGRCHTCDMCHLTLPNDCSYFAHMRMHKRVTPHTCPDCGQAFESAGNDFNSHLSVVCFHSCRISCYKCSLCSTILQTGEMFKRHLEDSHVQMFYKCRDCPMAFKTHTNISNHQRSSHGTASETLNSIKTIYKCPLCDTVFTDNNHSQQLVILQKHFETHLKQKHINITAYKCKVCTTICEKKNALRDHLRLVHNFVSPQDKENALQGDITSVIMTTSDKNHAAIATTASEKSTKSSKSEKTKVTRTKTSTKVVEKMLDIPQEAALEEKVDEVLESVPSPSSETATDINQSSKKTTRQPLKLRLKEMKTQVPESPSPSGKISTKSAGEVRDVNGKKLFVCAQCDKEFNSTNSRWNHIRLKHQGIKNVFSCTHCEDGTIRFAKRISINKHLKKIHNITTVGKSDFRVIATRVPTMPVKDKLLQVSPSPPVQKLTPKKGKSNSPRKKLTGPTATIRRHSSENDDQSRRESYESIDEEIAPEDVTEDDFNFPDVYICAKCKYESEDRSTFQDHIEQHREAGEMSDTSLWQCTECGLCFASVVSLSKHLFIKHRIRNRRKLDILNEKTRLKHHESDKDLNSSSSPSSFSCKICFKRFENDGLLRTHMRTHGLAFVKSKQPAAT